MENKEIEILKAEIERFKTEFRGTFIYENLLSTLTDDQIFDYLSIKNNRVIFNKHQTRQMWDLWQTAKATPEGFVLVPKVPSEEILPLNSLYEILDCQECCDAGGFCQERYIQIIEGISKAMIEAQEQK